MYWRLFCVAAADHSSVAVSIQPSIADVQEGQSLDLNCLAPGNPPPRVTWTKVSGGLSANHKVIPAFYQGLVFYRYFTSTHPKALVTCIQCMGAAFFWVAKALLWAVERSSHILSIVQVCLAVPCGHF